MEEIKISGDYNGVSSPKITADGSKNLLQELNDSAQDDSTQDDEAQDQEAQNDDSNDMAGKQAERRGSIESDTDEEVNWDELQKKEDEQAQDQDDNVSFRRHTGLVLDKRTLGDAPC